jgi:hypothetical protein
MFELMPVESKMLRVALDPSAPEGESDSASKKLIESWRRRAVTAYDIEAALSGAVNGNGAPPIISKPDWGRTRMPFKGDYHGEMFMDIPAHHLEGTADWIVEKGLEVKFASLLHAIREFLKQ